MWEGYQYKQVPEMSDVYRVYPLYKCCSPPHPAAYILVYVKIRYDSFCTSSVKR